jgi:hypothetical protein
VKLVSKHKIKRNKAFIIKSFTKVISDIELLRAYLQGKNSLEKLTENGIKIAKPI